MNEVLHQTLDVVFPVRLFGGSELALYERTIAAEVRHERLSCVGDATSETSVSGAHAREDQSATCRSAIALKQRWLKRRQPKELVYGQLHIIRMRQDPNKRDKEARQVVDHE